jgi:cytidine deaminase
VSSDATSEIVVNLALAAATDVRERAYAPYSRFRVGAAVVTATGQVFTGANVENASYGLTVCAERVAIWTGTAAGCFDFRLVVVVTDTPQPVTPCGACRQVLAELAPRARVVMATLGGANQEATVQELLPGPFGAADLSPVTAPRLPQSP